MSTTSNSGPLTREAQLWAALKYAGSGAVLDGPTALSLYGVKRYEDGRIHIRIRHCRHPEPQGGIVLRRTRHLEPRSTTTRHGYPIIRPERAVLTVAASRIGAIAESVQHGLTTAERLRGVLLSLGPIKKRSRMLSALADVEGGSRSDLEILFIRTLRRAGVPLPVRNYPLSVDGRRVWLDACYPDHHYFIEIDGKAYHVMCEDWEDDLDRQNDIVLEGWRPLRFSGRAIRERPNDTVRRVARAIGWDRLPPP